MSQGVVGKIAACNLNDFFMWIDSDLDEEIGSEVLAKVGARAAKFF